MEDDNNDSTEHVQYNNILQKIVTHSMSVSWQNRRRGQSLVAIGKSEIKKIKRLQQNKMFINYV